MGAPVWSATRVRTFQECRRKYHFRYHLAPLGRRPGAPAEAVEAERVSPLLGLEAWAGVVVHETIAAILNRWRAGRELSEEEAAAHAVRLLSRQFRDSRGYWSASPDAFPRRPPLLDLHYLGDGILSHDRAAALKEQVTVSVTGFCRSPLADRIRRAGPDRWLPIDRNAAARLPDGVTLLVRPDFAFRDDGALVILDWKSGRPDPFWEVVQVTAYALYAAEKWGEPLERIRPQIVHLYPAFRISTTEYSRDSIRDVQLFIRETHEEIAAACGGEELPARERFPITDDPKRCRWCQFRKLCDGSARCG